MTDFRELCRELLQIDDEQPSDYADWMRRWKAAIFRARAALAQPEHEVVGPTDQELADAFAEGCRDGSKAGEPPFLGGARAVLARWGRPTPAPAGEHQAAPVLEPALARINDILNDSGRVLLTDEREALELARQALEQLQTAPVPVPVAEGLPGPEDCDGEGRCWLHLPDMGIEPLWRLTDPSMRTRYHSHWLPAHALPLPQGGVE